MMDVPHQYAELIMSTHSGQILWLSRQDVERDFSGFINQYDEWFRANCPSLSELQYKEDERLREKHIRGERLTTEELAFRAEVDAIIEANVACSSKELSEFQERSRHRALQELLGRK